MLKWRKRRDISSGEIRGGLVSGRLCSQETKWVKQINQQKLSSKSKMVGSYDLLLWSANKSLFPKI